MFRRWRERRASSVQPPEPDFPAKCSAQAVDGSLLHVWQEWLNRGCHGIDALPDGEVREAAMSARRAATSSSEGELCDLARSEWAYVRFTVACNDHTPVSAHWGDGVIWFGLAGDHDPFVQFSAMFAYPEPPQSVLEAISAGGNAIGSMK